MSDGRITVDGFIFVYDISYVDNRPFEKQSDFALEVLMAAAKTKRPIVIAASKTDVADDNGRKALQKLITRKELRSVILQVVLFSFFISNCEKRDCNKLSYSKNNTVNLICLLLT